MWLVIYQATKRAHVYGAGARGRVGLARNGARGALRRGAEAGRGGDVSAPCGSARTGAGDRAGADGRAWGLMRGRQGGGRSVGCLPRSDP
jgi:hypothetical protein